MRAACLQFDVKSDDVDANISAVERGLRLAARIDLDLVVLPEMWPTSFPAADAPLEQLLGETDRALTALATLTRELSLCACGSAFGRTSGLPTNRWHLFESGERSDLRASYDKVHLFTPTAEHESFSSGEVAPRPIATRCGRVGGIVCYDLRFPEIARRLFRGQVELIAISAQWPEARASHWRALAIGRAVETQCFVVACNRTGSARIGRRALELAFPGNSLIVDPDGRMLAEGHGESGLVVADIDLDIARSLRVRVPIAKDERQDLYSRWSEAE